MDAIGKKVTQLFYYAVAAVVGGTLVSIGWQIGKKIWRMM